MIGAIMTNIKWDVLTMGNISRNLFWGEDDSTARRPAMCTSTFIKVGATTIVVDPPFTPENMDALLDRRVGLKAKDIDIVFVTHTHGDHLVGLEAFENATFYMPKGEIQILSDQEIKKRPILGKFKPATGQLAKGIEVLDMPGHTNTLQGLLFKSGKVRIAITGDAVMTSDFFKAQKGYFNSVDFDKASQTIVQLSKIADIIVPGHDNYFSVADLI